MGFGYSDALLGIDIGTSNVKAAAYTPNGSVLAVASQPLPVTHPRPGWSEYEPETLFATTLQVLRKVTGQLKHRVVGIAVASMGETAIPLSGDGNPLYNAIAWFDNRTRSQAEWWRREVGIRTVYSITGLPVLPIFGINKLLWFRENYPEKFKQLSSWLNVADYLVYRLCGIKATDYSLASRTMVFDLRNLRWSDELLEACKIDKRVFGDLVPSGQYLGGIKKNIAAEIGVASGTPVIAGGHDHPCGAFALGIIEAGDVLDSMGTAESIFTVVDTLNLSDDMAASGYQQGAHVIPKRYYCNGGLYASGACIEWLRMLFAEQDMDVAYALLNSLAEQAPMGSRGVFFLPHLRLANPPIDDLYARGAFVGLTAATKRPELIRAVLEGIAYEAQSSLEGLVKLLNLPVRRVRAIGGGTRNSLLMRIKAALLGSTIEVARIDEATTLGAALLAGVGINLYNDHETAQAALSLDYSTIESDAHLALYYRQALVQVYRYLYRALKSLNHTIHRLETLEATTTNSTNVEPS